MKAYYNLRRKILLTISVSFFIGSLSAQITERKRPAEWQNLVENARFMDRFLAMPNGNTKENIWGTEGVKNRYVDNGIEMSDTSFWGGNILQTSDGEYHLYVCGWPEKSKKGHMSWPNSIVYHAVSQNSYGPFKIKNTIGQGHNPEAFRLEDGRIVVYVIGGYYIADNENAKEWAYKKFDFDSRGRKIIEGLSNLTFAKRQDNSYLMVCRGGGIWISKDGLSTYHQLSDKSVYPNVKGKFEDAVVWRDDLQYHLIVNDWFGRIAFYQRSKDGIHWITEQGEAYIPGMSFHQNGEVEQWFKYERPKVLQDKYKRAIQMNFAVIDTVKWNDLPNDNHSSKNICIPLNKGMRLTVLNKKPISSSTRFIDVRISSEKGFNAQTDIAIPSLRFGSYSKVNFGQGVKAIRTRKEGKDLIVTFKGKGSGITPEEFAPKMLGKDKNGHMLYGYAKLLYINYKPAIFSAYNPAYNKTTKEFKLQIENFGLSTSKEIEVSIEIDNNLIGKIKLKALKPYEQVQVSLNNILNDINEDSIIKVLFYQNGKIYDKNTFKYQLSK